MTTTPDDTLVVDALTRSGHLRQRAASRLAAELQAQRAQGKDVRSSAVKVLDELAAGERLLALAAEVEAGRLVLAPPAPVAPAAAPTPSVDDARALAEAALEEARALAGAHDDDAEPAPTPASKPATKQAAKKAAPRPRKRAAAREDRVVEQTTVGDWQVDILDAGPAGSGGSDDFDLDAAMAAAAAADGEE